MTGRKSRSTLQRPSSLPSTTHSPPRLTLPNHFSFLFFFPSTTTIPPSHHHPVDSPSTPRAAPTLLALPTTSPAAVGLTRSERPTSLLLATATPSDRDNHLQPVPSITLHHYTASLTSPADLPRCRRTREHYTDPIDHLSSDLQPPGDRLFACEPSQTHGLILSSHYIHSESWVLRRSCD